MESNNGITKEIQMPNVFPTLSIAMIVKNEENRIGTLLEILKDAVDEIIIVDTGSTDNTIKICESFGIKPYSFPWNDSFSDARNESLKHCTKDYIMFLDADDIVEKQKFVILKQHLMNNPNTGVFIRLVDIRNDNVFETTQLRVFPRILPNGKSPEFKYHVHEQVSFSIEETGVKFSFCLNFPLVHKGYDISEEAIKAKFDRNLALINLDLKMYPDDFVVLMTAARTTINMNKLTQANIYVDKALALFKENKHNIAMEHVLMAYILKTTLLGYAKEDKKGAKLLESIRYLFPNNVMIKFTLGEIYFKLKNYEKAYKELLIIRDGKMPITSYPMDRDKSFAIYTKYLLASSLVVNDWKTASLCMSRFLNDSDFSFTVNKKK